MSRGPDKGQGGRPRKPASERRRHRCSLGLTDGELAAVDTLRRVGEDTPTVMRRLALERVTIRELYMPMGVDPERWAEASPEVRAEYREWRKHAGVPDPNCYGCAKIDRHHARGERGTVCMTHGFGPA